jgi:microcystin-dependent protein
MTAPFVGEVKAFGFNFAPRNYMFAAGQLLPIAQYTALFSILGTTYGGNGQTNFALPDLRGRVPIGNGSGAGLTPRDLGEVYGEENVTLITTEMAAHTHPVTTQNNPGSDTNYTNVPANGLFVSRYLFHTGSNGNGWVKPLANPTSLHPISVTPTGGSLPHNNIQPLLVVNWCIAVQGIFPARN